MRIVVCVRRDADGSAGPFDAAAYECALRTSGEVLLLSMGPADCGDWLAGLTRLGAAGAYLLSDPVFAGSDTLATVTILSKALARLRPDLVLCGRKTLLGDTGQVGPGLAAALGTALVQEITALPEIADGKLRVRTRHGGEECSLPAVLTAERFLNLRFPSLRSKKQPVTIWNAAELGLDPGVCGFRGSPTRVLETSENTHGRRRCRMIAAEELPAVLDACLRSARAAETPPAPERPLEELWWAGSEPPALVRTAAKTVRCVDDLSDAELARRILAENPPAVLFPADPKGRALACRIAVELRLGLCADVTELESDGRELLFRRPALAGNVLAEVRCLTRPALATVTAEETRGDALLVTLGMGAKACAGELFAAAEKLGAARGASRAMVDSGMAPYELQVGLTGRRVSPGICLCVGVSGAVQHVVGISGAGTVIAVNPDRKAPIFDYADYGLTCTAEELLPILEKTETTLP